MSCHPPLDYALYADGALPAGDARVLEEHLVDCPDCRHAISQLRSENTALSAVMQQTPAWSPKPMFTPVTLVRNVAAAVALLYAPVLLMSRQPILRIAIPAFTEHLQFMVAGSAILLALSAAAFQFGFRRARGLAMLLVLLASPAGAATYRAGEVVRIDGAVNGNVLVFARRVEIQGPVHGRVFAFAKEVEITGTVNEGVTICAETVSIAYTARIYGNVSVAGESANVAGGIAGTLDFYGERLTVAETARIGGHVTARVDDSRQVQVPPSLEVTIDDGQTNWADPMLYARSLAEFLAALLVAVIAARVFPITMESSVIALTRWWRSFTAGLVITLVAPAVALVSGVTVIGMPIAALILAALALAIYGAKLLAGDLAGRLLLPGRSRVIQLACGLALIFAAVALPWGVGGAVWSAMVVAGLGAFGLTMRRSWTHR